MTKKLIIEKAENKERLDKCLHAHFPGYSRSHLQKLIREGFVLVNGRRESVHFFLKEGDKVEIDIKKPQGINLEPDKSVKLEVIFENSDLLVINKQAGLVVHPFEGCREKTLVNGLLAYLPAIKDVGDDKIRPGLVHRLDKDVSGLMVIAKNQPAFNHLKEQFQKGGIKKEYLALVYGRINRNEGFIDFTVSRGRTGKFVARASNGTGKRAKTHFKLIKYLKNYSLLKIKTYTGRTHQIRVHLKALGYPIVGDQLYRRKKLKDKINLTRPFLLAEKLGFFDRENKWREYSVPLPAELNRVLSGL